MPNLLRDFYRSQIGDQRDALLKNAPDHLDPNVSDKRIHEHILKLRELDYRQIGLNQNIISVCRNLSDEQLQQFFRGFKPPVPHPGDLPAGATEEEQEAWQDAVLQSEKREHEEAGFIQRVRNGNPMALSLNYLDLNSLEPVLDALEKVLGPEEARALTELPITPPLSYGHLPEQLTDRPMQEELDELAKKMCDTGDPVRDEENRRLLERAGEILEQIKPEVLAALHDATQSAARDTPSIEQIVEGRSGTILRQGLKLLDGQGRFTDIIQPEQTSYSGAPIYTASADKYSRALTEEDRQLLDGLKEREDAGLSEATKDALLQIEADMKQLDYATEKAPLMSDRVFPPAMPTQEGQRYIQPEQGSKYYAFLPVVNAKEAVQDAVLKGDMEALAAAVEAYDRAERLTDEMMETLRSDQLSDEPIFSANVSATRPSSGMMPAKYALDYNNHNKLNSITALFGSLQNAGIPFRDLLEDPVGTAERLGEVYLRAGGLDGRPDSIGAALQNGLKGERAGTSDILNNWGIYGLGLARGMAGVAGLEKDPARRAKFMAAFQMGLMRVTERIRAEKQLYDTERKLIQSNTPAAKTMRGLIYQSAALAPAAGEGRFNLRKLMEDFSKPRPTRPDGPHAADEPEGIENGNYPEPPEPDALYVSPQQMNNPDTAHKYSWWDTQTAIRNIIQHPQGVDYRELARRNRKVLEDAEQERQLSGSFDSGFQPDNYLLHAYSAQSRLLREADEEERQKPGFDDALRSVADTWKLAEKPHIRTALLLASDHEALDLLKKGKDWQIRLGSSDEYRRMRDSLQELREVQETLLSGNPEEIAKLGKLDTATLLDEAKKDAFNYVRLKMKNGAKAIDSFFYNSGSDRAREGLALCRKLASMQDQLGLRSPAQKLIDECRETLLLHRADKEWVEDRGRMTLGKLLYAEAVIKAGIPEADQAGILSLGMLEDNGRLAAKHLMRNQDPAVTDKLISAALKNSSSFQNSVARWSEQVKTAYETNHSSILLDRAREDFCKGYAMDQAGSELGLENASRLRTEKNEYFRRKTEEVLQRPAFREIMERMMEGKSAEELRQMHPPAKPYVGNSTDPTPIRYAHAVRTLAYEKRCAELAAEASLRRNGNRPGRDALDQLSQALRQNREFRDFVQRKVQDMRPKDIAAMTDRLAKPGPRNQLLLELSQQIPDPRLQNRQPQDPVQLPRQPQAEDAVHQQPLQ